MTLVTVRFTETNVGEVEFKLSEVDMTGLDAPEDRRKAVRDYADAVRVEDGRGLTWISTTVEYKRPSTFYGNVFMSGSAAHMSSTSIALTRSSPNPTKRLGRITRVWLQR